MPPIPAVTRSTLWRGRCASSVPTLSSFCNPALIILSIPAILRSIEETSLNFGYSVIVGFTAKNDKHREAYADLMSNGRVDGVIIIDGGTGVEGFTGPKPEVPAVQVLDMVYGSGVPAIRVDDLQVAEIAVRHLASLGHRRIAQFRA